MLVEKILPHGEEKTVSHTNANSKQIQEEKEKKNIKKK